VESFVIQLQSPDAKASNREYPISSEDHTIAPPSFPSHLPAVISIPSWVIDVDLKAIEGSLAEMQGHHGTGKEFTDEGRCMYIFCS
jgi:hypothetical protein